MELAVCLLLGSNHAIRIPEFVTYHKMMGVEKFFIYYNEDVRNWNSTWKYFKPFVDLGWVEMVPYYYKTRNYRLGIQHPCYHECLAKAKGIVKWLGFWDADEFIQIQPQSSFKTIVEICNSFKDANTVAFFTNFCAYEGNATEYIEHCTHPVFINDWLLCKQEGRLPKSIHLTDAIDYISPHLSMSLSTVRGNVPKNEAALIHFRYPYKKYTIDGLAKHTYQKNEKFKQSFAGKVKDKLLQLSFDDYKNYCEKYY